MSTPQQAPLAFTNNTGHLDEHGIVDNYWQSRGRYQGSEGDGSWRQYNPAHGGERFTNQHEQRPPSPAPSLRLRTPALQAILQSRATNNETPSPERLTTPPSRWPLSETTRCLRCEGLDLNHGKLLERMRCWLEEGAAILDEWSRVSVPSDKSGGSPERRFAVDDVESSDGDYRPHFPQYPAHQPPDEGIYVDHDMMDWEAEPLAQPSSLCIIPSYSPGDSTIFAAPQASKPPWKFVILPGPPELLMM